MNRILPLLLAGVLSANLQAQSLESRVRSLAEPLIEANRAVGISVGVIAGNKRFTIHLGEIGKGLKKPDDYTVYEIGSISKVFTGLMLADAVVAKRLRLDQAATELLPDGVKMPVWEGESISLLHLATHRSGLPRLPDNMSDAAPQNPYAIYTSARAYEFLRTHELRREPGSRGEYSNFAVSMLGHLMCLNAEQSYDRLLRETITGPLKMKSTGVELTDAMRARMATPHDTQLDVASTWEFADMPGAGGIRSDMQDMLRFATANLNPPKGPVGRAIELAWMQHQDATGSEFVMGLGWHLARDGQTRWHNGGTGGFRSMLMIHRPLHLAVVVLSNTFCNEVDPLAEQIMQMLAGMDVEPMSFEEKAEVGVPLEKMKRLEGRYQLAPTFIFDVRVQDGKLMVGVTNQPTFQVFAKSEVEWFYKVVPASLTFQFNEFGDCTSLQLFQNGIRQTAQRVDESAGVP